MLILLEFKLPIETDIYVVGLYVCAYIITLKKNSFQNDLILINYCFFFWRRFTNNTKIIYINKPPLTGLSMNAFIYMYIDMCMRKNPYV